MTFAILLLALLLVTAVAVGVARTVRGDGLGHRPPPPSHLPWAT